MNEQAQYLLQAIDAQRDLVLKAERDIWHRAEPGFREWQTSEYAAKIMLNLGYHLEYAGNIPGFYTVADTGRPGPTVCVLAELDSLLNTLHPEANKETGAVHACAHNAQMAALLGLAAALKQPCALDGMSGRIKLCFVPAEEMIETGFRESLIREGKLHFLTGKAEFLYRGYFDDVDIAYMLHPGGNGNVMYIPYHLTGSVSKHITFHGVATHAAGPMNAVNALYAATQALSACNALRETFADADGIRWHPILTEGGVAVNAIPDQVSVDSMIRGVTIPAIIKINERINRAIAGSAASVGATVHISDRPAYAPMHADVRLNELTGQIFEELNPGVSAFHLRQAAGGGSTDVGFLSPLMPVAQPMNGGAAGTMHGKDFYITEPELACVLTAQIESQLLWRLLSNDAAEARRIKAEYKPAYATKEAFFKDLNKLEMEKEAVIMEEGGKITLDYLA